MKNGETRDETEIAVFSLVASGLEDLGLAVPEGAAQQLTDLVLLLSHWAPRINLTGHRGPLEMTQRLVLDAVALASALPETRTAQALADLGSGAGFPGLPIAILNPHLEVYLVDARLKRNHFQKEARRQLGLSRVQPRLGRSDEMEPAACDMVVAQAMAQPREALQFMSEWAAPKAYLVLPASEGTEPPDLPPGLEGLERREYEVPGIRRRRWLWVARKH